MLRRLFTALAGLSILMVLACGAPGATPIPTSTTNIQATVDAAIKAALPTTTATPTTNLAATVEAAVQATILAIPTPTPVPTPTATALPTVTPTPPRVPTPTATVIPLLTATPTATPISTPTLAPTLIQEFDLVTVTSNGLTVYYDPATTAQIQVDWVTETYRNTLEILSSLFGVSSLPTTAYLLSPEGYAEVFGEGHSEWTQGFARPWAAEFYLNRAPAVVWDESVSSQNRTSWLRAHVQEITEMTTAHELTHVALERWSLPTWIDEGVAQYVESLIAPEESAQKQFLQQRFRIRDAIWQDVIPVDKLRSNDWITMADSEEEFGLLYKTSALIAQIIAETSGDEGLRHLVQTQDLEVSLDTFIAVTLEEWVFQMLPEETAAEVLCGLNRALGEMNTITLDWNAIEEKADSDYSSFEERLREVLVSIQGISSESIVEDARSRYEQSVSEWIDAIDDYVAGRDSRGNDHLSASNSFSNGAYEFFSSAWDKYVVVSCALVNQDLQ